MRLYLGVLLLKKSKRQAFASAFFETKKSFNNSSNAKDS